MSSGPWRSPRERVTHGQSRRFRDSTRKTQSWTEEGAGQPGGLGVDVRQHLSFSPHGKACIRASRGQNRTRDIRLSGIVGGLWET